MKLVYQKPHLLSKLVDELLTIPELQPITINGEKRAVFILQGDGVNISLIVPDDAPRSKIDEIIQAHDPTTQTVYEPVDTEKAALAEAVIDLETRLSALEAKLNA